MKYIITIMSAVLMIGCASVGKPIDLEAVQQFEEGKTTQQDVRTALGSPQSSGITSDGEVYFMYVFTRSQVKASSFIPIVGAFVGGVNTDMQTLQIWFSEDGKLKNYQFNETMQDTRSGVNSY